MEPGERGDCLGREHGFRRWCWRGRRRLARVEDSVDQVKYPPAHRTAELTGAHGASIHPIREKDQELFFVVGRAAEVVGQLDEHWPFAG
jgi:hypothetical protein